MVIGEFPRRQVVSDNTRTGLITRLNNMNRNGWVQVGEIKPKPDPNRGVKYFAVVEWEGEIYKNV